jgi:hypothetical protein
MAWSLAGAALLLALGQGVATAATITVTTDNPNIIADGQCSLIEAIVNANNDAATHADCPAGSGADTIVLPANANVTLSAVYGNTYGQFGDPIGLPPITSQITIEGNGATIARQAGAPAFRLMAVRGNFPQPPMPGNFTLQNVTLTGGSAISGGLLNAGTVNIKNSIISGNTGHGIANGGILTIENSTISNNASNYGGGGIVSGGTLTIKNSTISDNTSNFSGGGVFNGGTLTIVNSTISNNHARKEGGGLTNRGGRLTIINSTISGNSAGGVSNFGGCYPEHYYPYGYACYSASLALSHTLITGNQAAVAPEIENVTGCPNPSICISNTVYANNFNLFGSNGNAGVSGFTPGPTDIVPRVPLANILRPLQNNGGPTQTHALVPGSPAIDTGDPGGCRDNSGALISTDQRGFARQVDGNNDSTIRCDIGAFEFGAESVPIPFAIGATALAIGEAGVFFTNDLMISGGVAPYIVSITNGKLPKGLSLGNDGIISGVVSPTARSEKVTVRITDSLNESITPSFTITVLKALHITGKPKTGRVGRDYSASFKSRGGLGPFSWSITSGALPPDLSFNSATGALTGIPTQAGTFPLTVQVTDALGGVDAETVTLTIK